MTKPPACDNVRVDDDTWVDARAELTALIDALPDQTSQIVLDYLRELLRTSTMTLYSLLLCGFCLAG